jgi:hypothetical protein
MIKRLPILLMCLIAAGCMPHFKSNDSYNTMFREPEPAQYADPYTFGGIGEGSGGTIARQTYPTDTVTPDPRDVTAEGKIGYSGEKRMRTPDPGYVPSETSNEPSFDTNFGTRHNPTPR